MTHTPGGWLYNDAESRIETDEADAVSLALIYCDDPKYRANARLIAAAPCLLEALTITRSQVALLGRLTDPVTSDVLSIADAAIAKARCES